MALHSSLVLFFVFARWGSMTDNSKRTGATLEAHYRFLMWFAPTLEKFPRSHKFTIGDRVAALPGQLPAFP